jgi:hypothetical protein
MSSHFARATESEMRTFRKSGGTLCTAPGEIAFFLIKFILLRYTVRDQRLEIHMDDYRVTQAFELCPHKERRRMHKPRCKSDDARHALTTNTGQHPPCF